MKQGSSGSPLELVDYVLLLFAVVLVTFLSIGALWNACAKKKPITADLYLSTSGVQLYLFTTHAHNYMMRLQRVMQ